MVLWGKKEILVLLFILGAAVVSFSPSLFNGFVNFDDDAILVENPDVRSLDWQGLRNIFTPGAGQTYIPLTISSFALEHHFAGLNPFVYHLDNLLLHLIVTALIFFLGLRLGLSTWAGGVAALVFAIHPMHVESVAWAAERKDVLYSVFYLAALHMHWSYLEKYQKRFWILTFVFGLLSMLAKPMALSLPLVLLLLDSMKGRAWNRNVFLEKIPHCVYIVPVVLMIYKVDAGGPAPAWTEAGLTFIWSSVFYLWKFFCPVSLMPLYIRPEPVSLWNPVYPAAILSLVFFVFCLIRLWHHRWLRFACLFYLCSIFFLFRIDVSQVSVVADRYMYLPSAGFCFLLGSLANGVLLRLRGNKTGLVLSTALLSAVFTALAAATFFQCRIWKDSITLWSSEINRTPRSWLSFYNRAKAYESQGKYDSVISDYDKARMLNPRAAIIYNNRAKALLQLDRKEESLEDLNQAIRLDPKLPMAYSNRGLVYARMKEFGSSVENFNEAIRLSPSEAALYYYRSMTYVELNRLDQAMADAQQAKALGYPGMDSYMTKLKAYADAR